MKIALFGGTFNPIHQGHLDIIEDLSSNFDQVWIIPTYVTPGKCLEIDLFHRSRMINHSIAKYDNVTVSEIEVNKKIKSYTYLTIQELNKKYPEHDFTFAIGFDNVKLFDKWANAEKIAKEVKLRAYFRNKKETSVNVKKYNMEVIEIIPAPISSTSIRSGYAINTFDDVSRKMLLENKLYLKNIVSSNLSESTFQHSVDVAELAESLAMDHNVNTMYAYIAGMFHDYTKEMSSEESQEILTKLSLKDIPKPVIHQYTAPFVLETVFGVADKDILNSIRKHTTADIDMNRFEKIIYIADKANKGRDKENKLAKEIREVAKTDLIKAFAMTLEWSNKRLTDKGIKLSEEQIAINNKWLKK